MKEICIGVGLGQKILAELHPMCSGVL